MVVVVVDSALNPNPNPLKILNMRRKKHLNLMQKTKRKEYLLVN